MNKFFYYILIVVLVSCYNDNEIQTLQSKENVHRNSELTRMIKAISAHNTTFDDTIDNTSCFSLVFPYQLQVNSELRTITSLEDISEIDSADDIDIVYPVQTIFYNYEEYEIISNTDFNLIENACNQNFNVQPYNCLDIQYPITFKEFNDLTQSFETFHLNTDRQVFLHLENLHDNDIFEIEYPIFLTDNNSNSIRLTSNDDFIAAFNMSLQDCE